METSRYWTYEPIGNPPKSLNSDGNMEPRTNADSLWEYVTRKNMLGWKRSKDNSYNHDQENSFLSENSENNQNDYLITRDESGQIQENPPSIYYKNRADSSKLPNIQAGNKRSLFNRFFNYKPYPVEKSRVTYSMITNPPCPTEAPINENIKEGLSSQNSFKSDEMNAEKNFKAVNYERNGNTNQEVFHVEENSEIPIPQNSSDEMFNDILEADQNFGKNENVDQNHQNAFNDIDTKNLMSKLMEMQRNMVGKEKNLIAIEINDAGPDHYLFKIYKPKFESHQPVGPMARSLIGVIRKTLLTLQ